MLKMKENAPQAEKEEPEEKEEEKSKDRKMRSAAPMKKKMMKETSRESRSKKMDMKSEEAEEAIMDDMAPSEVTTGGDEGSAITVRSNFSALANFSPSCVTDKDGKVSVDFKLPDSLTRYRVWAVAATERQFGLGESTVTVKLPFMVRPSFPRFLNFGDKAECSVVLQNQMEADLTVRVAARCTNARFGSKFTGGYT
jgi:hypothetical protein